MTQLASTVVSQNAPPGVAVARYDVTVSPNAAVGGVQLICARPSPSELTTEEGLPGAAGSVPDDGPSPPRALSSEPVAFVAFTENRYESPLTRPVTVIGLPVPEAVLVLDGSVELVAVTVYPVTPDPPSFAGPANDTEAVVSPAETLVIVGAPGGPTGTIDAPDCSNRSLVPPVVVTLALK